jgi:hypothetical protein
MKETSMSVQLLTLKLAGINAGDYLDWVRDPEPPALDLRSITVCGEPLGDTIEAVLSWKGSAPVPSVAAPLAGLPLTADVIAVVPASSTVASTPTVPATVCSDMSTV